MKKNADDCRCLAEVKVYRTICEPLIDRPDRWPNGAMGTDSENSDTKGTIMLSDWLEAEGAARDVVDWARPLGARWAEAWETCPRGDWLLGLAARLGTPPLALLRAATSCAELAETYLPDDDQRARTALKSLELHLAGAFLSPEQLAELAHQTEAAVDESPDPAAAAAALSVLACLRVLDHPGEAALAAASVAQAAVLDTGDCAVMSALRYAHRTCADRVRAALPFESLNDHNAFLLSNKDDTQR